VGAIRVRAVMCHFGENSCATFDHLVSFSQSNASFFRLSSGAYGDRYLSPHSILTNMNRGSTPRLTEGVEGKPGWYEVNGWEDFDLENYPERDLFAELVTAFHDQGIKVIAYMAAQGPTFLKHDETRAYDYNNKSPYVNSTAECNTLTDGIITDGSCSPSARKWANHVRSIYGTSEDEDIDNANMQKGYAELIVREYAEKFNGVNGPLIDGFWFDQGTYANYALIHDIIVQYNPNASMAFNRGQKMPLINNSPP